MTRLGSFQRIHPEVAHALLFRPGTLIFDVRDRADYDAGHVAGADHLSVVTLEEVLLSTPKSTPILIYCYHGFASQEYATIFADFRFTDVYSLDGGFEAWREFSSARGPARAPETVTA